MFAVAVSCGLPAALHELGHTLTQTSCEAAATTIGAPSNVPALSVDEKLSECWIQTLVSSVAQHAYSLSNTTVVAPISSAFAIVQPAAAEVIYGFHPRDWFSPRGPPVV